MLRYLLSVTLLFSSGVLRAQHTDLFSGVMILLPGEASKSTDFALLSNDFYGNSLSWKLMEDGAFVCFVGDQSSKKRSALMRRLDAGNSLERAFQDTWRAFPDTAAHQGFLFQPGQPLVHKLGSNWRYRSGTNVVLHEDNFLLLGCGLHGATSLEKIATVLRENATQNPANRLITAMEATRQSGGIRGKLTFGAMALAPSETQDTFQEQSVRDAQPVETLKKRWETFSCIQQFHQALEAYVEGNEATRIRTILSTCEATLPSVYEPVIRGYILSGQEEKIAQLLVQKVKEDPAWSSILPKFHLLRNVDAFAAELDKISFRQEDWFEAIDYYLFFKRADEAIYWINKRLEKSPDSGYLYYLMGKAYLQKRSRRLARKSLQKALKLDKNLTEARDLLETL